MMKSQPNVGAFILQTCIISCLMEKNWFIFLSSIFELLRVQGWLVFQHTDDSMSVLRKKPDATKACVSYHGVLFWRVLHLQRNKTLKSLNISIPALFDLCKGPEYTCARKFVVLMQSRS